MREHPIPQDVTGYRFHIIGNLTLKQFVEVAGGVVLAVILYKLGLPAILKWPLIVVSLALGTLGAFVPIAGRSFDQWVIIFFKVIYRPTIYYWKRKAKIPEIFSFKPKDPDLLFQPQVDLTPQKHQRVNEYLASVGYQTIPTPPTNQLKPTQSTTPTEPNSTTQAETQTTSASTTNTQTSLEGDETPPVVEPVVETDEPVVLPEQPQHQVSATEQAVFNQNLPFPSTPTIPNKLVGMVLTQNKDLVPSAIVEVYNQAGGIERAVKSNALGQFFITTPLPSGQYVIKTTRDGLTFEPLALSLTGEIIPPLEIIASSTEMG